MNFLLLKLIVFIITAVVGIAAAHPWLRIVSIAGHYQPTAIEVIPVEEPLPVSIYADDVPLYDPDINYTRMLKVKLLMVGSYYEDEAPYRSGETWLGLFRCGDSYELRNTKVFIKPLSDIEPGDRDITTSDKCESVFILRGATTLSPGRVETQFDKNAPGNVFTNEGKFSNEDFAYFRGSTPKGFGNGRGSFWKLWVDNPSKEGFLQKGSSLVLSRTGGSSQVLRALPNGCNDCGWSVEWVGDLDQDGNLDLLIDVSGHYNVYEPTLFLSSAGEIGSVGIFAIFWSVGC